MSKVFIEKFGETDDGHIVNLYKIISSKIEVGFINYGAAMVFLNVPNKSGQMDDIITGFDTLPEYFEKSTFFGSVIGRVANRIACGKFTLDGKEYTLPINNGPNTNHGGLIGFDKRMWEGSIEGESVVFRLTSPDGDEGFPGEVVASVTYTVCDDELVIKYHATSTKPTPINMTSHSFYNLSGHDSWDKDLSNHEVHITADEYLPTDEHCLVTGEIASVDGTVFDLRKPTALTEELLDKAPGLGIDHNFCVQRTKKRHCLATFKHPPSGRVMVVDSTEPGVQLYTGNFLKGSTGKKGVAYTKHSAFCIESQNWPDAINNKSTFPDSVLRPGGEYNHTTWMKFDVC